MNTLLFLGRIGMQEILLIALLVLLFFGGKKIPELMRGIGKGIKSFKDGIKGLEDDLNLEDKDKILREYYGIYNPFYAYKDIEFSIGYDYYFRDEKGYIWQVSNGRTILCGGITLLYEHGFCNTSIIYLSRIRDQYVFFNTVNHELTHAYLNAHYYSKNMDKKLYVKFSETMAYQVEGMLVPSQYVDYIHRRIVPAYLIPVKYLYFYGH